MSVGSNGEAQSIISEVQAYIHKQLPEKQAALLALFVKRYYSYAALEDLKPYSISDLYKIVYSHWQLINARKPNETKIRIFNPDEAKDGWKCSHTVIQISQADIPFLVDSTRMVVNRHGYEIHHIIHFGGMRLKRDQHNQVVEMLGADSMIKDATTEAPIYIEIDRVVDEESANQLKSDIERVLVDVQLAVTDWRKMVGRVEECLSELESQPPNLDTAELAESRDFLRWAISNNFTFLGARDYKLIGDGTNRALQLVPGSGLGVLRSETLGAVSKSYSELPPQARKMALSKNILIIAKTNTTSSVHRDAYTDYIGVKRFNEKSELIGERRFIGLYTSSAYHSSPRQIPFLRHKVDKVLEALGFPPDSHDGKEAVNILETLPRDDLFQATHEELVDLTLAIIQIKERKRIRLLVRRDAFYRYFSCLVYVPREIFTTDLALAMQDILMQAFKGFECTYTTYFSDSNLARIHYIIRVNPKAPVEFNVANIEKWLVAVARSWHDELKDQLILQYGESAGLKQFYKYNKAFPASYSEVYSPKEGIEDIKSIESLSDADPLGMRFFKGSYEGTVSLKLFHAEQTIILSDVLPILENMGLRIIGERPHEVKFKQGGRVWINEFVMVYAGHADLDVEDIKDIFRDAFIKIWFGGAENDGLNRLVLECKLTWQETAMLRAYTKYLRQTGFNLSQSYIEQALINNPETTKALVQLFATRFDPSVNKKSTEQTEEIKKIIESALENVASLDEDRIIRRLLELMYATLRTNYFQLSPQDESKPYLSLKFDPAAISDLPLPRPKYEIFVYSPLVEGVHLRGGKVARGGLRWSDRLEDFRTEVLGLMKAQQVKNTVIVPVGAKGGFVVKAKPNPELGRDEYMKVGIQCYTIFIKGMLDITDNIIDNKVVPPKSVVSYDEVDSYLVVAADKGTATFSDIANGISREYNFWLDDAFASGGSAGYDHKKMGITSRGAWVSVERHFREIGLDPAKDDFTVVGVGDMSGDVFGNGMLLSEHILLIGAFNHMHIFIDPNPNPATSFAERKRLFALPRSGWGDYDDKLISPGGGVFSRSAKSIKLSPEMKERLNTKKDSMVPNELIKALFRAPVDLIWNGGIGTFVKSSQESHLDVGDRTNDNIRVDATELTARVVAEGGNLGFTQLARIEYSLNGGIINTDFIDNSAGVDCSDHEVNLKILLNQLMKSGEMSRDQRNKLLEKMTDEVAKLVLLDNYDQTQMLSLETSVAQQTMDFLLQFMSDLEKQGRMNRALEYLPDDKAFAERKANNKPLTRPEIAMLLAYCKMFLKQDILATGLPEDIYFDKHLLTAFPSIIADKFLEPLKKHSLRREIVATQLCKSIVDRMGINFVERLQRETGASIENIIRAYAVAESAFRMEELWCQITVLDNKIDTDLQYRMMLQLYFLVRRATRWFIRNRKSDIEIQETINEFQPELDHIRKNLPKLLDENGKEALETAISYLVEQNVPEKLAKSIATCNAMFTSLDIVETADKYSLELDEVAKTYYQLGNRLELNWLREIINSANVENHWEELARSGFRDDLDRAQRKLSARVLMMRSKEAKGKGTNEKIELWVQRYQFLMDRWMKLVADLKANESTSFVAYSIVIRELFDFSQAA